MVNNKQIGGFFFGICSLLLASCATTPDNSGQQAPMTRMEEIEHFLTSDLPPPAPKTAEKAPAQALPASVEQALLPPPAINLPPAPAGKIEPRFDIAVNKVNARSFFLSLMKDTPENIIVHPDVKGRITLNLKDVTIAEVMQMVYDIYGYEYEHTRSGYIVRPNRLQSRMFKVDYLNVTREGRSETRVSSGQPSEGGGSDNNRDKNDNTVIGGKKNQSVLAASEIRTESSFNFWSELQASIQAIIGEGEDKSVVISPQSGLVVVRAYPSDLRKVEQFLASSQDIMKRQVIIEAKVLEVELSDGYQQGINWAAMSNNGDYVIGQTGGGQILQQGVSEIAGASGNLDPGNFTPIAGNAASAFGGVFTLAASLKNFKGFFEFDETQGNIQVLSSPRVSTVNNQKAVIKVGTDEFFVTEVSSTTTTGVSSTTSPQVTLTPFFSGISLDVTPQIDENGEIILHIHPTISEVVDQEKTISITTTDVLQLPLAFSTVRESDSIVHAKNGQIIVIGGLMKNKVVKKDAATPILSSIPILGQLFKHKIEQEVKSELVILLRPVVVDNDGKWAEAIRNSSSRVKQIYHDYDNN